MKKKQDKKINKELSLEKKIIVISILFLFILLINTIIYIKRIEIGYPIDNLVNKHESITKEHCLDDICINNMTITYNNKSISSISGMLKNKSNEIIDACFKIKFTVPGREETMDFNTCYYDLEQKEVPIETYFNKDQKDLVFATSYTLEYLKEDELKDLYEAKLKDENN